MQALAKRLCKCRRTPGRHVADEHRSDSEDETQQPSSADQQPPQSHSSLTRRLSHPSPAPADPSSTSTSTFPSSTSSPAMRSFRGRRPAEADPPPSPPAEPAAATPTLSAEQIRAQRLKKLEQTSKSPSSSTTSSPSSSSSATPAPSPPSAAASSAARPIPRTVADPSTPPHKPLSSSASSSSHVPSNLSPAPSSRPQLKPTTSAPVHSPTPSPFSHLPPTLQPSPTLPAPQWQSELILDVLSITLDKHRSGGSGTRSRVFLAEAAKEATAAAGSGGGEREKLVTVEQLDGVLIERMSLPLGMYGTRLGYLLAAYRRVGEVMAALQHVQATLPASYALSLPEPMFLTTPADVASALSVCDQLLSRLIAFCCMVLTDDDPEPGATASGQPQTVKQVNQAELLRLLFSDPSLSRTLPPRFLDYLVQFTDVDQLAEVFTPIISLCSPSAGPIAFESAKEKVQALATLSKLPPLATLITTHPTFIPAPPQTGRTFQVNSLLGIHLSHLTSPSDPIFANIREKTQNDLDADFSRQRADYGAFHTQLTDLFRALIRDSENRDRVVTFFTTLFTLNVAKRKTYYDQWSTATDSLFFTCLIVLLKLSMPIVKKSDMGVVRLEFVVANDGRLSYEGETRLMATSAEVATKNAEVRETAYNFSTECFFLTHECLHLLQPLFRMYLQIQQKLSQMQQTLRSLDRSNEVGERRYEHVKQEMDALLCQLFALNAHLLDPAVHADLLNFLDYTAHLIHHHLTQGSPSINFLPESLLECLIEYYVFLGRFCSPVFSSLSSTHFTHFPALVTSLAAGPHALKNPHLRAKLPAMISLLFLPHPSPHGGETSSSLSYLFESSPAFLQSLMPSLIDLYVEIEFGDRMFFPKFNVRYEITLLLEHLYTVPHYRQQLIALSRDLTHFLAFTNALANDLVYLFDEGLKCLTRIKEMQAEQETEAYQRLTATVREEKEREYQQEEGHCTSYLQLASSTIHLLSVLTADIVEPFTTHRLDFVSRFATTLTYYIHQLVGPSISSLKVKHKERYHFAPRVLLKEMIVIFLHLSSSSQFLEKVASDERSYSPTIFDRAYSIMKRREILDPTDLRLFHSKKTDIQILHANLVNFNDSLGDVPDKYLDALLSSIMADPVRLPRSKQVVDRVTIQRHLMNSRTDPFNRSELKEEELIDEPELKDEIEQWMRQKKEEWLEGLRKKEEEKAEEEKDEDSDMKTADGKDDQDDHDML